MCNFGIRLTWTSEEGLPLFKEEVAEYFPLPFFVGGQRLKERESFFCFRVFSVKKKKKKSWHIWVKRVLYWTNVSFANPAISVRRRNPKKVR